MKNIKALIHSNLRRRPEKTKRFDLYRKICVRDIGIESFTLYENTKKSEIILINNEIGDGENY